MMRTPNEIADAVLAATGVDTRLVSASTRGGVAPLARAVCAALARRHTVLSLSEIAVAFGWRSHSSVREALHGLRAGLEREAATGESVLDARDQPQYGSVTRVVALAEEWLSVAGTATPRPPSVGS